MLEKKVFVSLMNKLIAQSMNDDEMRDVLEKYGINIECSPASYSFDIAINAISAAMHDECDLITYWFFDDDHGKHGLNLRKYAPSCPVERIQTVEELYDALAEMYDEHYYDPTVVSYVQLDCDKYGEPLIEVLYNRKTRKYLLYFDVANIEHMDPSDAAAYLCHARDVFCDYCNERGIRYNRINSIAPVLNLVNNGGTFNNLGDIASYFCWASRIVERWKIANKRMRGIDDDE